MTSAENLKVPECPPLKIAETKVGNISYREKGNGNTLLILHGNLGNSRSWAFQLEDFSRSYRVVAWDAPGYGRSDEQAVNIDAYAEALAAFLATPFAGGRHASRVEKITALEC